MAESEIIASIRAIVSDVDMHRNREKREALDAIRELVGVVEKAPEPEVVEPEAVIESPSEPAPELAPAPVVDGRIADASEPEPEADAPADAPKRRGRPPRVAADDASSVQ